MARLGARVMTRERAIQELTEARAWLSLLHTALEDNGPREWQPAAEELAEALRRVNWALIRIREAKA